MLQTPIPMDPRLLGAVKRALGRMPAVPYDLTQVKVLDNFYSPVDPYWDNVPECFAIVRGDFSAIGRMEKLRQLSVVLSSRNQTLDMGDFSWLPRCKNLQHLDLALTNFSDCALLLQLPALKTVRLPGREQLAHWEALDALPQSVKVRMDLTPYPSVSETFKTPPPPKPKPEPRSFYQPYISEKFPKGTVVELNSADSTTLRRVPGIGPVFASRIVRFRSLLGGFYTVSQLREVYGIDEERYRSLAPWFRVDTAGIVPLRVNQLSYKQLASHPYLSKAQVRSLCSLRALKRQLSGWGDLSLLEEFAAPQHRRLRHYLSFE